MDEKDRKIRELERELAEARREADRLRPEESRFRYTPDRVPPVPGPYWYDQRPAPPPRAKPGRIALIIVGCLAVLAVVAAALVFFAFTMLNSVDRETTGIEPMPCSIPARCPGRNLTRASRSCARCGGMGTAAAPLR